LYQKRKKPQLPEISVGTIKYLECFQIFIKENFFHRDFLENQDLSQNVDGPILIIFDELSNGISHAPTAITQASRKLYDF
jgi:hypothetical protein